MGKTIYALRQVFEKLFKAFKFGVERKWVCVVQIVYFKLTTGIYFLLIVPNSYALQPTYTWNFKLKKLEMSMKIHHLHHAQLDHQKSSQKLGNRAQELATVYKKINPLKTF